MKYDWIDSCYVPTYPDWKGERAVIIGGGPSVNDLDWKALAAWDGRKIALNEAGLTVCPDADLLYWADRQWGQWNEDRYHLNKSEWRFTSADGEWPGRLPNTRFVRTDNSKHFHTSPKFIVGIDSGSRAINLAYHCGIRTVYLLGYDMKDVPRGDWRNGYFHEQHKQAPHTAVRSNTFVPAHGKLAAALPPDFQVINCTKGSALKCYPSQDWNPPHEP